MRSRYEDSTISSDRDTKPKQTRPQTHSTYKLAASAPQSQSLKAESTFTDPCIPRKLACIRTKQLSCYIRKSNDLKRQIFITNASSFPLRTPPIPLMQTQNSTAFKFSRMLQSLYGIKIRFFSPLWGLLRYYGILNHYIQTATNIC